MTNYVDCDGVRVGECEYGLGVFARKDFKAGDVVETGIMMRLEGVDGNLPLNHHLFTWSDDRKQWACGSGCLPFYNHSETPNVKKVGDLTKDRMIIVALKDIKAGDELRNRYMSRQWRTCFKDLNP